jgi:hypothetical protein
LVKTELKVVGNLYETSKFKVIGYYPKIKYYILFTSRLSAMDISGLVTMKDAASCDTQCDLQTSENH